MFLDGQWIEHHEPCEYPVFTSQQALQSTATNGYKGDIEHTEQPGQFQVLTGETVVPPEPAEKKSQILYFFQGLEARDDMNHVVPECGVLRPVLAWLPKRPDGQKPGYAISAVWSSNDAFWQTQWKNVTVGDHISMEVLDHPIANTFTPTWEVSIWSDKTSATSNFETGTCNFNVAIPAAAEVAYSSPITSCAQVPRYIFFQNIQLFREDTEAFEPYSPTDGGSIDICRNGDCPPNLSCGWHIQSGKSGSNDWTMLYM